MIRAVLDTNTLATGSSHVKGPAGLVFTAWKHDRFTLVTSEHIHAELTRTFEKRYFQKQLTKRQRKSILTRLYHRSMFTDITAEVSGVATHPEDDLVLATAVSAAAEYLVTQDMGLLGVGEYQGVQILTPQAFLRIIS